MKFRQTTDNRNVYTANSADDLARHDSSAVLGNLADLTRNATVMWESQTLPSRARPTKVTPLKVEVVYDEFED